MRMIATLRRVNVNTLKSEEIMFSCLDLDSLLVNVIDCIENYENDGFTPWHLVKAIVDEEGE